MGQVSGGGGDQGDTPRHRGTGERGPGEQGPSGGQTGWTAHRVGGLLRELAYNPQRRWSKEEYEAVVEHVAKVGFDPAHSRRLPRRVRRAAEAAGELEPGTTTVDNATAHYLDHVVEKREWPEGTDLSRYLGDLQAVVRDPGARFFVGFYGGADAATNELQLTVVRRSRGLRGPGGGESVLVDYRVALDSWVTGFQPAGRSLSEVLGTPRRAGLRLLPKPAEPRVQ